MGAFSSYTLPSTEEEVWRYSRIAELDLDAYTPVDDSPVGGGGIPEPIEAALATVPVRGVTIVVVNGRVVSLDVDAPGVDVVTEPEDALGIAMADPTDVFAEMNDDFTTAPVVVRIAPGATIEAPIVIARWVDEPGIATFPRTVVVAGEDSRAKVVEYAASANTVSAFMAPVTELSVARAARLDYLNAQNLGMATWQIGSQVSTVDADATLTAVTAAFGGDYARQRTDCRLVGRGATGRLRAVYFGEADQMLDFRTFQDHAAPDTTSNLLFKGAVQDTARSVYTGLIRIGHEAKGSVAYQTNRNLTLSAGAWAESVPNLEIETNDVKCSHASTIGPIDEDQRFYLESRGIPPKTAERLVVLGFFDEVLSQLPVGGLATELRAQVAGKLDRRAE